MERIKQMHGKEGIGMNRRTFLRMTAAGMGALSLSSLGITFACSKANKTLRPNIVLIMADDMGYSDIGCYGGEVNTPNINRLAAEGLRFSQFYNAARCCPTRASLLTGLYPHQAGMGGMVTDKPGKRPEGPYQGYLNDKCVTIAEVLREAGYRTLMSGKWHVGEFRPVWPVDRGFEKYFGLISGAANYFDITKGKRPGIKRQMAMDDKPWMPPKEGFYMTDAITENALKFLDSHGSGNEPFFLYVAYTAPHWPLHALPEDIAKYKGKYMKGWDKLREERYQRQLEMGLIDKRWKLSPRDPEVTPWDEVKNKEEMEIKMAVYAAQIDRMDQGIGKILNKLKELGKDENTLVMFLSDNGACHEGGPWGFDNRKNGLPPGGVDSYMSYGRSWANASNTPFKLFKHWVHEGGISTPLIVRWPKVIKEGGKITHQVGHIVDIMATCCEVAGTEYPRIYKGRQITPLVGKSLLPIFQGKTREGHEVLYWEHMKNKAIRKGKWKLVSTSNGQWELYNVEIDRTETNNLAEQYPEVVDELKALFQDWAEKIGVEI